MSDATSVSNLLMWILIILLVMLLAFMVVRLFNKLRGDNKVFYEEKGAINLRVQKLPDIRIATKNCKDFKAVVYGNVMVISYANPFGGMKKFKCRLSGDPIKQPFMVKFTEADFKKFCYHIQPGNIAVFKTKITFNYNLAVKCRYYKLKKGV